MNILDDEEREILEAFDNDKLKQAADASTTKNRHQTYAEAMFKKDARINIHLSSRDLRGL
jgi:predicted DNA binding CopG/RHH family protein